MRPFALACALALHAVLAAAPASAQQQLDASLNESVQMVIKKSGMFSIGLETTLYKPDGDGPFPIVVINHGKEQGNPRFQPRYRPAVATRWFLERGYAVVVPMRQGFSKSEGSYIGGGCNVGSNGHVQAEDVKAALDHATSQPWADKDRILVVGQSHGGWTTLAFGTLAYPGVRGLVNFAGGLRQEDCNGWKQTLASSAGAYAKKTQLPSIWFYGDNDSYFGDVYRAMHQEYEQGGGRAQLVAFGTFGADAHGLFGARAGRAIWGSPLAAFLASIGMPSTPVAGSRFAPMAAPARTAFAPLDDAARVPFINDGGRNGYREYLTKGTPRAFAIAPNRAWGWADGGDDPLKRALDNCNRHGKGECKLYSVDEDVVWRQD